MCAAHPTKKGFNVFYKLGLIAMEVQIYVELNVLTQNHDSQDMLLF